MIEYDHFKLNTSHHCRVCTGSGKLLGMGMMYVECRNCDGYGTLEKKEERKEVVIVDKRSKSYKDALIKIMDRTGTTREQAVKIFDEEFEKF